MLCGIYNEHRLGCGQPILKDREYRCVDCGVVFCRACLRKHCGAKDRWDWRNNRPSDLPKEVLDTLPVETRGITLWLRSHKFDTRWSDAREIRIRVDPDRAVVELRRLNDLLKEIGVHTRAVEEFPVTPTLRAEWVACTGGAVLVLRNVFGADFP